MVIIHTLAPRTLPYACSIDGQTIMGLGWASYVEVLLKLQNYETSGSIKL